MGTLLLTALGLAMDAVAVAIAHSLACRPRPGQALAMAGAFGGFQAAMPLAGLALGAVAAAWIGAWDHWLILAILSVIGGKMLWESWQDDEDGPAGWPGGWTLVLLAVATSIDALAAGVTLALLGMSPLLSAAIIGAVTLVLCLAAIAGARRLGAHAGPWAERIGGVVLIGIGVKVVVDHLSAG
jgi:putative Mn2+ efflux pump MntP